MKLAELSVRRHVLALMASLVFVLFGIVAYERIGVDRFPRIEFPVISVTTVLPGANPDVVDSSVTNIIETAVNSVPGIDFIQSRSSPGVSTIVLTFDLSKDIDVAFSEVQAKVNQVLRQLPDDADPPVVLKVEVGASPVIWLALQGDRTQQQLNQYARQVVKKRLETIDGVGQVIIGGERRRNIRVELDLDRMAALGVTAQDVRDAFRAEHVQLPGGFLVSGPGENLIKLDLEYHSPVALGGMVVRYADGAPVHLRDVAGVVDGLADDRQFLRFNGKPAVGIGIVKVSNYNTVKLVDDVRARLEAEILPQLPPGLSLEVSSDDSTPIRKIVHALENHLVEGTVLAGLVVWFFLRSFRSTLIIATAIPVSLLGAIAAMYFLGYTFNQMSMLGLLLLIGVVVDDAIVVLENVYRRREEDPSLDRRTAAIEGTEQVGFAVVAASLTLVSIFGSVLFLEGIIARFFQSFAVVVTVGVLVSLFVSLTLTPMLCSRFLEVSTKHGRVYRYFDRILERVDSTYRRALGWVLVHRWKVLLVTFLVVLSSGFFFARVGKDFIPQDDDGRFLVTFRAPLGTSREAMEGLVGQIDATIRRHPEVVSSFVGIGLGGTAQVNTGIAFVTMVPRSERDVPQHVFIERLQAELSTIPGALAFAAAPSPIGGQRGEQLQFSVVGPDLDAVASLSRELARRLGEDEALGRIDLDLQLDLPQVRLDVDRERAADLGLSSADVAYAVNMLAGGVDIAKYNDDPGDGDRYDIRVKAADGEITSADDLRRIFLRTPGGQMVRLDTVARAVDIVGPAVVTRYALQYSANFYTNPTMPLGAAVERVRAEAAELLPPGYSMELQGRSREFAKTSGYVKLALMLALALVYIVLASQFNSFVQPLIVMTAQPLAIVGGLFALWATGTTLNMVSMIGLILLMGLVAKNSILLVDLTNQLRASGRGIEDALREACPVRLRPVLMTSLTVILALLPAALGLEAGADTNGPMAIAVIGGMVSSTLLTLVVVPAVYSLVERGLERLRRRTG
ncbi:MAG: efflux RND transporter permease subunit [Lysobacterales bacterium]|jgi:HAE1 family hydrophobic/amphiphilic exporter-1|nr:MAG: efflux RND transporter permease subunit [Xanthomonadales bacterium]